jgi:phospholipid N-methyltransferase
MFNEIFSDIENVRKNKILFSEKSFNARLEAIEFIEFHIIDRIDVFLESKDAFDDFFVLKHRAIKLRAQLEEINAEIFRSIRVKISQGHLRGKGFLKLIEEYLNYDFNGTYDEEGYDNLDIFLNGFLNIQELPMETREREPEIVYYQKTPARIILKMIEKVDFKSDDVFFDLGSGLGQACILVNLFSSIVCKGVEFEPAFCSYAKSCAHELNLRDVNFINTDARYADYSSGTVFFMYTPFEGEILKKVLQNLKREATKRKIKIFTYGPCTPTVAKQEWLVNKKEIQNYLQEPGEFHSI